MGLEERVRCGLGVWGSFIVLLLLVQLAATLKEDCPHPCVSITKCSKLLALLRNPTTENVATLRDATCAITNNGPTVCCPRPAVAPPPPVNLLPKTCGQGPEFTRIHGGTQTPIDAHPWMAVLGYTEVGVPGVEFLCGGSVINERYVLTAAHCVHRSSLRGKRLEVIRLGEWDLSTNVDCEKTFQGFEFCSPPAQDFTSEEIIPHPAYNSRVKFSDDIALIRLDRPIDLSGHWIHPVCLPPQGLDVWGTVGEREALVAGWGFTENGTTSDRKLHVPLPFVDAQQCNSTYHGDMVPEQICMGGRAGQDSCAGDSGGPLMVSGPHGPPFLLIGVVSYGPIHCGQASVPGVYTSVAYYKNWIEQHLRP